MNKRELLKESRVFLSMPNPWIIHEFTLTGNLTKKIIIESLSATFKDNNLYGVRVSMDSKSGSAYIYVDETLPPPVSFFSNFQELNNNRSAELLENKHLIYADVFKIDKKHTLIRLYTHHVVCDGKGGQILINDFIKELNARIQKLEINLSKNISPVSDYKPYMKGNSNLPFIEKLFVNYFNSRVACKRPDFSYDDMIQLQKKAFLEEGFICKNLEFTEDETAVIIKSAKEKGISVTAFLIEKTSINYNFDKVEISLSIDGRRYYDLPQNSKLLPLYENHSNFASGGKIIINKTKYPNENERFQNISDQLKKITEFKKATQMMKIFGNMNFAPIDITNKRYANMPMTPEEQKIDKAISNVLGFEQKKNGFDFASFGKIEFLPTDKKYSVDFYHLIQNTASVYPLKFGVQTYKKVMSILITYKPSIIDEKTVDEFANKLKLSLLQ